VLKSITSATGTQAPIPDTIDASGSPDALQRLLSLVAQAVGAPIAWLTFLEPYQRWGTLRYVRSSDDCVRAVSDSTALEHVNSAENIAITIPDHTPPPERLTLLSDTHTHRSNDHHPGISIPAGARFYACAPIYVADATPVGVLCLADWRTHNDTAQYPGLIANYTALISESLNHHNTAARVLIAEAAQRAGETFNQAIIDSLAAHIAVLDRAGTIIAVNTAWNCFAYENGATSGQLTGIGANYLQICRSSDTLDAQRTLEGLEGVLSGAQDTFSMEYPCHSSAAQRWFLLTITPLRHERGGAVMAHVDITARKRAEDALQETKAALEQHVEALTRAWQQAQREREFESLDLLSSNRQTSTSARLFGNAALQDTQPALFETLIERYAHVLDRALAQRMYNINYRLPEQLRGLSEQLSFLGAGPRDVIVLHTNALRRKVAEVPSERAQAYLEESRLLVLELMGSLVASYRLYAQGRYQRVSHGIPEANQP
jgi:PAS domain S-box-containing protein